MVAAVWEEEWAVDDREGVKRPSLVQNDSLKTIAYE